MVSTILWPGQKQHLCSFYIQKELTRKTIVRFYTKRNSQGDQHQYEFLIVASASRKEIQNRLTPSRIPNGRLYQKEFTHTRPNTKECLLQRSRHREIFETSQLSQIFNDATTRPTQQTMTTTSRSHDVERSRRQKRYQETSRNGGKSRITFQEDNKKNRQYFTHLYTFNFNVITHFYYGNFY